MTPADGAAAVAEAILAHEGVKAWEKLRGEASPEDLQQQTIDTLRQAIQDAIFQHDTIPSMTLNWSPVMRCGSLINWGCRLCRFG